MNYDLVFEGGGAKGMVFVGALEEFFGRGHAFVRLLGTSAGVITATLLAAGYTPQEMLNALQEKENGKSVFSGFMGEPAPFSPEEIRNSAIRKFLKEINLKFVPDFLEDRLEDFIARTLAQGPRSRHFFSFVERGGWYAADRFVSWLQAKLDTGPWQGGQRAFSHMTLKQFFDATGVDLSVVASDTSASRLLVLNHRTAPDCPVVWAVRMSMSIPLVWQEVVWGENWGTYLGHDMKDHVIVDGGMLSNFPIELFISADPQVTHVMGPKKPDPDPVMGLLIDESLPVPPVPQKRGMLVSIEVKPAELRTVQRIKHLIDTMTHAHDKMVMEEFDDLVVRLPAKDYGTTEFDMTDERRQALVTAGQNAMAAYLTSARAPKRALPVVSMAAMQRADHIALRILQ
jgi:NTE family protein